MKAILSLIGTMGILAAYYFSHQIVPIIGPLLLTGLLWVLYALINRASETLELARAAKRVEPVFIVSMHPETSIPARFPTHIDELCIHVPYQDVILETKRVSDLLLRSENGFCKSGNPADHLPVVPVLFRDGIYVNEEWSEFEERALSEIKDIRARWHVRLCAHKDWYYQHHHRQKKAQA